MGTYVHLDISLAHEYKLPLEPNYTTNARHSFGHSNNKIYAVFVCIVIVCVYLFFRFNL